MKVFLLTLSGFALVFIDLVALPGGVLVAAGSGLIIYSIYLNFITYGLAAAVIHFLACLAVAPKLVIWSMSRMAVKEEMRAEDGFVGVDDHRSFIGKTGRARSDLRPAGSVTLETDGGEVVLDCITEGGFVDRGQKVVILEDRGTAVVVRRLAEAETVTE